MPGKVLKQCQGKPLLQWTIDRLKNVKISPKIIVATSKEISDDVIHEYCIKNNINFYRGSLHNVIERMIEACQTFKSDYFIRVCGDSPIIDPNILDKAIMISKNKNFDLITNTAKRTYPKGQSVEIIKLSSLKELNNKNLSAFEKEHVTVGFHSRKNEFSILNFESNEKNLSNLQLSVDTYQDYKKIEHLIKLEKQTQIQKQTKNYFKWQEFSNLYEKLYE